MICDVQIQGRYKLVVKRPDNSVRLQTPWFDNLITQNGMNQIGNGVGGSAALATQCYIGQSANIPTINDTQLGSIVGTANSVSAPVYTFFDGVEAYWRAYKIFTFNAGNATGDIREVAVGFAPNNLFSRSLIWGVEEIPATITVLADEKLEVYYERRNYVSKFDAAAAFSIASGLTSAPYAATIRASDIDTVPDIFSGFGPTGLSGISFNTYEQKALGTVYEPISGASAAASSASVTAYVSNQHYRDYTFQFDTGVSNFSGGIGTGMFRSSQSRYQFLFTPYVQKTSEYRMRFTVRHTWSRYVPAP